ncbi:MAG: hypothetical protein ABW217_16535 [Polyangiaceae bacterium]
MQASVHLTLVEPLAAARRLSLAEALLGSAFRGLCAVVRKAAELYGTTYASAQRESPAWLVGAGQIAPVVAGRSPLDG